MDTQQDRFLARQHLRRQTLNGAAAAAALAGAGKAPDVSKMMSLLHSHDPYVREGAIKSLAATHNRDAMAVIARCMRDSDIQVRAAACRAIGLLRGHEYKGQLYDAVMDKNPKMRCAAAEALGHMGDKYGLSFIAKLVCTHGDHQIDAIRSLNAIAGKEFRCNQAGLEDAIRWIKSQKNRLV